MRHSLIVLGAGLATALTMLSDSSSAAPANGAAARAFVDDRAVFELVQHTYRGGRLGNDRARQRYINSRLSRMPVDVEPDGTILLPGINTNRRGQTIITGAPRSRGVSGKRIGVWQGGSGGRLGTPMGGTGGRITGNVPGKRH